MSETIYKCPECGDVGFQSCAGLVDEPHYEVECVPVRVFTEDEVPKAYYEMAMRGKTPFRLPKGLWFYEDDERVLPEGMTVDHVKALYQMVYRQGRAAPTIARCFAELAAATPAPEDWKRGL